MRAKVFISCGQKTPEERKVASSLEAWFTDEGYDPYLAISAQTIGDINRGIIEELKSSDMYVLVNFVRDHVVDKKWGHFPRAWWAGGSRRGSLFSNQELAIAYAFGFEDHMLVLNQQGVENEGVMRYMGVNTPSFEEHSDVLHILRDAIKGAGWSPSFSRNLLLQELSSTSDYVTYSDLGVDRHLRIFYASILNNRPDFGATQAVARLKSITPPPPPSQELVYRSQLKATAHRGFDQTIWPKSIGKFDIFGIERPSEGQSDVPRVFLNSALDLHPRPRVLGGPGVYNLHFEVFAQGFPKLTFEVVLDLPPDPLEAVVTSPSLPPPVFPDSLETLGGSRA